MGKKNNQNKKVMRTLTDIQENSKTMARNSELTNEKLDSIQKNNQTTAQNTALANQKLDDIQKSSQSTAVSIKEANEKLNDIQKATKSKLSIILAIISLVLTVSGVSAWEIYNHYKERHNENEQYEIYLYSEYSKVTVGIEIDLTATLNFDTDSVSVSAYLASGNKDTLAMEQKNETEWQKKVYFEETGIHKIVVTAVDPKGNIVEDTIEVEVIPVELNNIMQNYF